MEINYSFDRNIEFRFSELWDFYESKGHNLNLKTRV